MSINVGDVIQRKMAAGHQRLKAGHCSGRPNPNSSYSGPVIIKDENDLPYVVKPMRSDNDHLRGIFNDQVIARLGLCIGARVGQPHLMDIGSTVIKDPDLQGALEGPAHATELIPNYSDRIGFDTRYVAEDENRLHLARYALLYGWSHAGDWQVITSTVNAVTYLYSVDHGHHFPCGPGWTINSLQSAAPAQPDQHIMGQCGLARDDLDDAYAALSTVSDNTIAEIIGIPPVEWGVTLDERIALADYYISRRDQLLSTK